MKKWETALLIAFFMVFAILFFAVGDFQLLRQTKTSRISEIVYIFNIAKPLGSLNFTTVMFVVSCCREHWENP